MDLSKISTADLVQELSKREGVEEFMLEPYQQIKIVVGDKTHIDYGPAVILKIQDCSESHLKHKFRFYCISC